MDITTAKKHEESLDDLLEPDPYYAEKKNWTTTRPDHEPWEPMRDAFTTDPHEYGDYTIRFHVTMAGKNSYYDLERKDSNGDLQYREITTFHPLLKLLIQK
jgi:hypothetical protein